MYLLIWVEKGGNSVLEPRKSFVFCVRTQFVISRPPVQARALAPLESTVNGFSEIKFPSPSASVCPVPVQGVSSLPALAGQEMRVDRQRDAAVGVPQVPRHRGDVLARFDHVACEPVPERMRTPSS